MHVHVTCYGPLASYQPAAPVELSDNATPDELLLRLELPRDLVMMVFANGEMLGFSDPLPPGGRVGVFPIISGG